MSVCLLVKLWVSENYLKIIIFQGYISNSCCCSSRIISAFLKGINSVMGPFMTYVYFLLKNIKELRTSPFFKGGINQASTMSRMGGHFIAVSFVFNVTLILAVHALPFLPKICSVIHLGIDFGITFPFYIQSWHCSLFLCISASSPNSWTFDCYHRPSFICCHLWSVLIWILCSSSSGSLRKW